MFELLVYILQFRGFLQKYGSIADDSSAWPWSNHIHKIPLICQVKQR